MSTTMPTPDADPTRSRRPGRRRIALVALVLLLALGLLGALVLLPADGEGEAVAAAGAPASTSAPRRSTTTAAEAVDPEGVRAGAGALELDPTPDTEPAVAPSTPAGPGVGSNPGSSTGGGPGVPAPPAGNPAPSGPQLVVPSDVHPEPGSGEATVVIANAGGSPLHWSIAKDDWPTSPVSPEAGTIAPGAQAEVYFELPGKVVQSTGDIGFTVESDGGTAKVTVHLVALEPVFDIVGGTYIIRNGDSFLAATGDLDMGLKLKNLGDVPLTVTPEHHSGLDLIGGPWVLAPGEQVHLQVVLCNASYGGAFPDWHFRDLHLTTDGWQGTVDFSIRFTLEPGQVAPAC